MKSSELKDKSKSDLIALRDDLLKEAFNLRMQKSKPDVPVKTHRFKEIRRTLARIAYFLGLQKDKAL